MNLTDEQVRRDWESALGVDKISDDPEAFSIAQLMVLLDLPTRDQTRGWIRRGLIAGTIEETSVYRDTGGGHRWIRAFKLKA